MLMTKQEAKTSVSRLRKELKALKQPAAELNHSAVCELMAHALGYKNWSALEAHLTDTPVQAPPEALPAPAKVFLARYDHRHGLDCRVFRTEEGAEAWKTSIAQDWWEEELPEEPKPSDEEIGKAYFGLMGDCDSPESFDIEEVEVEDTPTTPSEAPAEGSDSPPWPVIRFGEPPLSLDVLGKMPPYDIAVVVEIRPTHFYDRPYTRDMIDREWLLGECLRRVTGSPHGLDGVRLSEVNISDPSEGCLAYLVRALELDYEAIERDAGKIQE